MKSNPVRRLYDDVYIGQRIDGPSYVPNNLHANLMNIANWGAHRIHYDKEWALRDGFTDVVVQGALLYGWVEKLLTQWVGQPGCLRRMSFRNLSIPLVGQSFELSGEVLSKDSNKEVTCEVFVRRPDNQPVVVCKAVVRLA